MGNMLYVVVVILIILWAIGLFFLWNRSHHTFVIGYSFRLVSSEDLFKKKNQIKYEKL
jgi:FtsH-binding integral membrane protein